MISDVDGVKMVALAYRTHRQFDASHDDALNAAVKAYGQLHPEALPDETRRAVITIIAQARPRRFILDVAQRFPTQGTVAGNATGRIESACAAACMPMSAAFSPNERDLTRRTFSADWGAPPSLGQ